MFNIVISDTIYNRIIASNEGSPLHRLLKQQPSRLLSSADTDYLKQHPEDVQKSPWVALCYRMVSGWKNDKVYHLNHVNKQ